MKCCLAILGLLVCQTTCHVTPPNFKKTSTSKYVENGSEKSTENQRNVTEIEKNSLQDIEFALKNQEWSKQEELCLNEALLLIESLQNFTLWAVWDWDSIASEPQGLLYGSRYQLGNFDECLHPPWLPSRPELKTQYCLADIILERIDNAEKRQYNINVDPDQSVLDFIKARPAHWWPLNTLTWGVCVPASCGPGSVERLVRIMVTRSHLGAASTQSKIITENCQKQGEERAYDGLFWAFFAVLAILTAMTLVCTYLNNGTNQSEPKTLKHEVVEAFCLKKNANNLLKVNKTGTEVLYGIRFLSLCGIIFGHQFGNFIAGAVSNGVKIDQDMSTGILASFSLQAGLLVDTFFFLSGFLTAATFSQIKRFPNPLIVILKRYFRLVPGFAIVIFFVSAVYPHTGSGPLWPKAVTADTDPCRKNWWLGLLMLNNYIDSDNMCLMVSWYIPCDFHFFCVAVIIYWIYTRRPRLGLSCAVAITVISIVLPGIVIYVYGWSPIVLMTPKFLTDPRASPDFHRTYNKSHIRATAYIVGFVSGFIFVKNKRKDAMRISQKAAILGSMSGFVVMIIAYFSGPILLRRENHYHPLEGAVYAAINRPVWTVGVAMLVLCCSLGHVPLIKSFLSWYIWVPLSRLAYGLYLAHYVIVARGVFNTRNSQHFDVPLLMNTSAGVIFWGCVAAFAIWLIVEAPATRLFDILLKQLLKKQIEQYKMDGTHHIGVNGCSLPATHTVKTTQRTATSLAEEKSYRS